MADTKLLDHRGLPVETKSASVGMGALDREFFYSQSAGAISAQQIQKQPFQFHAWTYACAYAISMNICRMHICMYNKQDPSKKIIDHPVLDLFRQPNPLMTRNSFLSAIILNLLLSIGGKNGGQCFIICDGKDTRPVDLGRGQIPIMLTPVNDKYVKPNLIGTHNSGIRVPNGWIYDISGDSSSARHFGFNEIIRVFQYNPYDILHGVANEHPARIAILQDVESDIFNERMFTNMAIPAGMIMTDQKLSKDQKRDILAHWYETLGGPGNVNRTAIMDQGTKYNHIGLSNVDMQFTDSKEFMKEQIIAAFHLNKIAIGDYEQINKATIEIGRKMLWHDVYMPMAELILEAFNSTWIQYIDDGLRIGFDTSQIEALRDDYTNQSIAAKTMVDAGMPPIEAFKINKIPLPDDAEQKYPWLSENPFSARIQGIIGAGSTNQQSTQHDIDADDSATLPIPDDKSYKKRSDDEKDRYWDAYISKVFEPGEKSLKVKIIDYLNKQRNKIQDNVDRWNKENKNVNFAEIKEITIDVDYLLFDKKSENIALRDVVKPVFKEQSIRDSGQLAKEGIKWKTNDKKTDEYIKQRSEFLNGLNDLTFEKVKDKVKETVKTGIDENLTPQELAKKIKDDINEVYETRKGQAQTIARTEIGAISSSNRFDAMKENDVEALEWVTAGDEKVRDSHLAQGSDGNNIIKVGQKFDIVDLHYPCESGGAPEEVINCRCVAVAAMLE